MATLQKTSVIQFAKFLLSGLVVIGTNLGLYHLMANLWQINYIIANSIAFVLCGVIDYFLNKYIVFSVNTQRHNDWQAFFKFLSINIVMLGIGNGVLFGIVESGFIETIGLSNVKSTELLWAKIMTTGATSMIDFIAKKSLVFQPKPNA